MASPAKLDVDEFGRLVRENVTDSDSSRDSSRRKRRRRDRKRSRSRSSSRSHRRRRERRERSRSFSPIRRRRSRSRSRTPVLRRRDKGSRNKGEEECFDFKMGKCYRGPNCRYSHNVNGDYMSDRDRLGRRKQTPHNHKEETDNLHPSTSSVHGDNVSIKDEELKLPLGIPDLKQVKLELPADNGNKVPQIDQECKTTVEDSLVYESFSPTEPPSAALTHIPTVEDHTTQNVNVQTTSVVSPMTISLTTEKVPSQSNLPLPPIPLNIPLAQPFSNDHNFRPPFNHKPDNYQPSQSPMPYYFAPPPPPPHFNSSMNMTQSWQNGLPSYAPITPYPTEFHSQSQPLQYQAYPTVHGPSQIPPSTDAYRSMSFPVSNMTGQQAMNLSHPVVQSQSNSFHSSIGVNMPSTINPSQSLPYQFNTYAAQPQTTNYASNALIQGNDRQFNPMHGASVSLESDKIGNVNPSSSSAQADRPGYNQYDPLFDSMEPPSNSVTGAGFQNVEAIGDSDHFQKSNESSKVYDKGNIKQEGDTAVSANESIDFEEFGETADVVNRSSSTPNNAMDTPAGEIEIDQVKASGEKSRSTKLFKVSIAAFVKDVLKPSWRQGNMSKEAFKTIVKKTVDKVSGAMKSHKIPKSQAKVNQYIDSSRGKLTKLVMGYVDKYVKV